MEGTQCAHMCMHMHMHMCMCMYMYSTCNVRATRSRQASRAASSVNRD